LSGANQTAPYTIEINVATSALLAWNLTITSTTLTTGGATPHTLSATASKITGVTGTCIGALCTPPINIVLYPITIPAGSTAPTAVKFYDSTVALAQSFKVTPAIQITVPPTAYAGTYTGTLTVDINSGP